MFLDRDHRLCLAAAWFLADHLGTDRALVRIVSVPEREDSIRADAPVELIAEIAGRRVAFEHTQLESHPRQIEDAKHGQAFVTAVERHLQGPLPPGTFTIVLGAIGAVQGLFGRVGEQAAEEVARWIERNQARLVHEADRRGQSRLDSEDLRLKVTLLYRAGDVTRPLHWARWAPKDLETLREDRIRRAFSGKLPKLQRTRDNGCQPCLVLEDQDISLGHPDGIVTAARASLSSFGGQEPDWIVLVETQPEPALWLMIYANGEWVDLDARRFAHLEVPTAWEV